MREPNCGSHLNGGFRVIESPLCPACSSPVLPGQAYCATCGTSLPGASAVADTLEAPTAGVDPNVASGIPDDPRLAALGLASTSTSGPEHDAAPALERQGPAPSLFAADPAPAVASAPDPAPGPFGAPIPNLFGQPTDRQEAPAGSSERIPGGYVPPVVGLEPSPWTLRPSSAGSDARGAGSSIGVSIGAIPVSSMGNGRPRTHYLRSLRMTSRGVGPRRR
jgi:hypothetical protein